MGRFFTVLVLASAICAGVAWQFGMFDTAKPQGVVIGPDKEIIPPGVKIGDDLYSRQALRTSSLQPRVGSETLQVGADFKAYDKMDAAPQVPGQILFIGQEIPEGVAQVGGVGPLLQGKVQAAQVDIGDSKHYKFYTRLSEGDVIGQDEMVGLMNPAKAIHGVREKMTKLNAAEAEEYSAKKIHEEAERRLAVDRRLFEAKVIAEKEFSDSKLTTIKTWGDWVGKREQSNVARIDVTKDKLTLAQHYVCNKLPVKSSIIKTIYKRTGEAIKELDPMVHLYAVDRMVADGPAEIQYLPFLKLGTKVTVEPSRESSPMRVWRAHKKEVTAVGVANVVDEKTGKPVQRAVSGSEDRTVYLWSEDFAAPTEVYIHSAPVQSLACSPAGSKQSLLLVGLTDGSIYVWDLNAKRKVVDPAAPPEPLKPVKILKDHHNDAITALAFSPDGRYFASGSTDGSIVMWDTTVPEYRLYPFDAAHGVITPHTGKITSLHFTPQSTLISAGRDETLRIWKLGQTGAAMIGEPLAGRSGTVASLGVTRDGSALLFDQGKTLQILAPDSKPIATLQNPAGTIPFETLAVFSPDDTAKRPASMLLTAGASEGRLQLWKSPLDGNRAFELRQFVTSERAPVTAVAFFDVNAAGNVPFAVSGTKDGIVYLWQLPTEADVAKHRIENVELTQIAASIETKTVRIGVQVPNDGRLTPGQPVTIVIDMPIGREMSVNR